MKKQYIIITILIVTIFYYIMNLFLPKNYELIYTRNGIEIKESYSKEFQSYKLVLKYKNLEYPIILNKKYSKERRIVKKIDLLTDDKDLCLKVKTQEKTNYVCSKENELIDYRLASTKILEQIGIPVITQQEEKYEKITIFNNNKNYMIWNYKGFININKGNKEKISLFKKEQYSTNLSYQFKNYLLVPDYDSKYFFTKMYLIDTLTNKVKEIESEEEISYNSSYLGDYKNNIYLLDEKTKSEYKINLKKLEIEKEPSSNGKIKLYEYGEWNSYPISEVISNNKKFEIYSPYSYEIDKENLYQIIDSFKIRISDKKISSIVSQDNNIIYYLIGDTLYTYNNEDGECKLLSYKEWKYNSINQIFIYE